MLVAAIVCLAVALAVAVVLLVRTRREAADLDDQLTFVRGELTGMRLQAAEIEERAEETRRERDDALERVQRARRDAAEVANRLSDETAARTAAEQQVADALAERDELQERLETAVARGGGRPELSAVAFALALARIERLWQTSISLHADETSPLRRAEDVLHAAAEVVVDAAREEAGADIELDWSGDSRTMADDVGAAALALVEGIVATASKTAGATTISVRVGPECVEIDVDEDGAPAAVPGIPDVLAVSPGRYRIG